MVDFFMADQLTSQVNHLTEVFDVVDSGPGIILRMEKLSVSTHFGNKTYF